VANITLKLTGDTERKDDNEEEENNSEGEFSSKVRPSHGDEGTISWYSMRTGGISGKASTRKTGTRYDEIRSHFSILVHLIR